MGQPHRFRSTTTPGARNGNRHLHRIPLLISRFRYPGKRTLYGQARFYGDRIVLVSVHLTGLRKLSMPLLSVVDVDYHPLAEDGNLTIHLDSGAFVSLHVEAAHRWREQYENWLNYHVLASAKLMTEPEKAFTLAG
jgi:hypothetical protein